MLPVSAILPRILLVVTIAGGYLSNPPDAAGAAPFCLEACPSSPNCVSSEADDSEHRVEAFRLKGDFIKTWTAILRLVTAMPRTVVVSVTDHYIRAECKSRIFRFVDDLELLLKPESGMVSVRSASRSGYYDFGVNRKRAEHLRQALLADDLIEP